MNGSSIASMAWRNLWRNRRRTALTLSSIVFGTSLAILFTGIGDSNWRDMIDLAARLGGGHVTLQHHEYLDTPTPGRTVTATPLRELALRQPEVDRVVTRISGFAMLSTAAQSYGTALMAYDPEIEDETTLSVLEALSEGRGFRSANDRGIIVGAKLAENLDAGLGRKVVYTLTDKRGEIVQEAVRVIGIIHTGAPTVDAGLALLPIDVLRDSLGYAADEAIQVGLFIDDQRDATTVAARLQGQVGERVSALPWYELQPELAGFIAMKIAGAQFMELTIALLVAAGIFNTLFVSVMERMREFGIMMAIGFSPGRLFGLVMFESLWLGLVGLGCAALVVAWPYYHLHTVGFDISERLGLGQSTEIAGVSMTSVLRADIYFENLVIIAVAALLATLLAGLYPAWRAGRVAPVESIKLV